MNSGCTMILKTVFIVFFASLVYCRPPIEGNNVITVPPNCPPGQKLINGVCRDVWRVADGPATQNPLFAPKNVVTVPINCPPGQELINGVCRDVWRLLQESAIISPYAIAENGIPSAFNGDKSIFDVPKQSNNAQKDLNPMLTVFAAQS